LIDLRRSSATPFFFNTSGEAARVGVAAAEPTTMCAATIQKWLNTQKFSDVNAVPWQTSMNTDNLRYSKSG
jgi:hypothetical protein